MNLLSSVIDWEDTRFALMLWLVVVFVIIPFLLTYMFNGKFKFVIEIRSMYLALYAMPYMFFQLHNISKLRRKIRQYEILSENATDYYDILRYDHMLDVLTKEHIEYMMRYDLAKKLSKSKE